MRLLLFDVFKHLLLRKTDFSKLVRKVNCSENLKKRTSLKSEKVKCIFRKTFILALLSSAVFCQQNHVSDFC